MCSRTTRTFWCHAKQYSFIQNILLRQSTQCCKKAQQRYLVTSSKVCATWEQPKGYDTGIYVWNTLNKRKDPLILRNDRIATWYLCGPTVYASAHIGHGSTYMRYDIIRRVLESYFDITVMMVMGLTDIDDKLIARANETGIPFAQIAWQNEIEFFEDMSALNILPPNMSTKVTEYVPHIITFIKKLLDKDYAYAVPSGSVYFDVNKYKDYGLLRAIPQESSEDAADLKEKKNAADFALWKGAKPGEPMWDAPWGSGRPGWHIECSVMASEIFGSKMDIHAGGEDLIFPHHENELAQSHCFHDCTQWANYWLHTGHLYLKGSPDKMSKSLKNFITISEFLDTYTADQFRVFCLLTHYRNRIEYTEESMQKAVQINSQIHSCLHHCDAYVRGQLACRPVNEERLHKSLVQCRLNIEEALKDDFNTPCVMDNIMELVKQLNISLGPVQHEMGARSPAVISYVSTYLRSTLAKFGLQINQEESCLSDPVSRRLGQVMDTAVKFRSQVRQFAIHPPDEIYIKDADPNLSEKDSKRKALLPLFQACDDMRDNLKHCNIHIADHGKEASWKVIIEKSK